MDGSLDESLDGLVDEVVDGQVDVVLDGLLEHPEEERLKYPFTWVSRGRSQSSSRDSDSFLHEHSRISSSSESTCFLATERILKVDDGIELEHGSCSEFVLIGIQGVT